MIKTSDEGTSYCPQCEAYAREIERLKARLDAAEELAAQGRYASPEYFDKMNKAWRKAAGK